MSKHKIEFTPNATRARQVLREHGCRLVREIIEPGSGATWGKAEIWATSGGQPFYLLATEGWFDVAFPLDDGNSMEQFISKLIDSVMPSKESK